MRGSLGEKIGVGTSADVHAWAPGQVVKLFKAGLPRRVSWWEARVTRAVFASGCPAPEVLDEVTVEGRFGVVLQRFDGPTLLQLTRDGGVTFEQAGAVLADLALQVHRTPPPRDTISLHDYVEGSIRLYGDAVPAHLVAGLLALIDRLSPDAGLCHGDIHPDNVIMTAQGPRLIDWSGTARAPAACDLAVTHFGLTEIAPLRADNPQRPRAVAAAALAEYARLSGTTSAALLAAIEPCLPIVCARILLGGAWPEGRERLIARVEAALRGEL
jgi:Ser/Thr protein kinase RdoA (MazF antagonist)